MANKVQLEEDEYATMKTKLNRAHINLLGLMQLAMQSIDNLNNKDGGFYVERLTPRIAAMNVQLKAIITNIDSVFKAEEDLVVDFVKVIDNIDHV